MNDLDTTAGRATVMNPDPANAGDSPTRGTGGVHPAWKVLAGCCLLYGGVVGVIGNSAGIYMVAVTDEMGWSLSSFNVYLTLLALVMTVTLPIAGRVLPKYPFRLQLGVVAVVMAVTYGLGSTFTALWQWNVAGIVLGICYGFLMYIPIPLIITNWFAVRNGTALGIAAAFASLVAAIVNPVGSALIGSIGWRGARVVLAVVSALFTVPAIIALIRRSPEEYGLRPYGVQESPSTRVAVESSGRDVEAPHLQFSLRSPVFWMLAVIGGLFAVGATMLQQVPSHAARIGLDPATGAAGVSAIMIGAIGFKVALGWLNDRTGTVAAALSAAGLGIVGSLVVVLAGAHATAFLLGCALFGGGYAGLVVIPPLTVRHFFGAASYGRIYSFVTFAVGAFSALGPVLYSWMSDRSGTFTPAWEICMGFYALIAVLVLACAHALALSRAQSHTTGRNR